MPTYFQDNSRSLLAFLVFQYVRKFDEEAGTDKAMFPLPEPSDVNKAALVNFDEIENELKSIQTSVKSECLMPIILVALNLF